MIKQIGIIVLTVILLINSSVTILACDEERTNVYVRQLLFGENAIKYENNDEVKKLQNALFICSEQANSEGKDKLTALKRARVNGVPALEEIKVGWHQLFECSHNSWDYKSKKIERAQAERKQLLRKTITNVFDFGWFEETFKRDTGKIDSFASLLYYTHILADYLADNPIETKIIANDYDIPAYSGKASITLNGNVVTFTKKEKSVTEGYTQFSDFDEYGRTGVAIANIGQEILAPASSRQDIGNTKPTGWNQQKYIGFVSSEPPYLYNRCHLIAHQLVNVDDAQNLITGTRYLNEAMIQYENKVAEYVRTTSNHVLYKATPIYEGDNLLASGIQLEAYSIEDKGEGLQFNVYLYNVQPGIDINYVNGYNEKSDLLYGKNDVIPFVVQNPSDDKPDLMYEIAKGLAVLFADQKSNKTYKNMMNELDDIADGARNVSGKNDYQIYSELKKCQYDYIEVLTEYVPKLLEKEKFFNKTFCIK